MNPPIQGLGDVYAAVVTWNVYVLDYQAEDPRLTLPPSENNIRIPIWHLKRLVYTKEAQKFYQTLVKSQKPDRVLAPPLDPGGLYLAEYLFGFPPSGYEPGWKAVPRMSHANGRLVVQDTSNRRKLVGDALADILGVDDHRFIAGGEVRFESPEPYLGIRVHLLDWHRFLSHRPAPPLPPRVSGLQAAAAKAGGKQKGGGANAG